MCFKIVKFSFSYVLMSASQNAHVLTSNSDSVQNFAPGVNFKNITTFRIAAIICCIDARGGGPDFCQMLTKCWLNLTKIVLLLLAVSSVCLCVCRQCMCFLFMSLRHPGWSWCTANRDRTLPWPAKNKGKPVKNQQENQENLETTTFFNIFPQFLICFAMFCYVL